MLSKDGFKKFMKYDACHYPECRYSKVSNHIHCVRPGSVLFVLIRLQNSVALKQHPSALTVMMLPGCGCVRVWYVAGL